MNTFLTKARAWLSPARREQLYVAAASIAPILVTLGILAGDDVEPFLVIVSALLQGLAGLLALLNLTAAAAAHWYVTAGRGIIYSLATVMAPAAVALGWFTEAAGVNVLTGLSLALTALAAIIGVINLPKPQSASVTMTILPSASASEADIADAVARSSRDRFIVGD